MDRVSASNSSRPFVLFPRSYGLDVQSLGVEAFTGVRANDHSSDQVRRRRITDLRSSDCDLRL
jgi:hypothetical protein